MPHYHTQMQSYMQARTVDRMQSQSQRTVHVYKANKLMEKAAGIDERVKTEPGSYQRPDNPLGGQSTTCIIIQFCLTSLIH